MPKILDNINLGTGAEMLETLKSSYRLDAAIGYFNLRGWQMLAEAVDALPDRDGPKARVLVGIHESPIEEMRRVSRDKQPVRTDNRGAAELRTTVVSEYRDQLQVGLPTKGDETTLRALLRQIKAGDVEVRVHTAHRLHAKLYLCHRDDSAAPRIGYVGSSNLTFSGLSEQGELNVDVVDGDATNKLADWFEDRWNDRFTVDAMPELAESLRESWASEEQLAPYLVYLKMAYHLSKEARDGLIEYGLPASMQEELLDFQSAAVKIASRIVMQKGGAMIGDVVGLGKTLVGTAIARLLQEEQSFETLVVCPKNLVDMWESYLHKYEVRGRVESLSMVHKNLPDVRRHRLVIVDEAHNLRNKKRRDHQALQHYITENDSKALLLTATPYNKQFGDLAAQLSLFIHPDTDLGLRPEHAIEEAGIADFMAACDGKPSTLQAFERSEHLDDWQALMSQYLVRRTRRFVEDHYATEDEAGRRYLTFGNNERFYFPKRTAMPTERTLTEDDPAYLMASEETLDSIRDLRLPRYRFGDYLSAGFKPTSGADKQLVEDLKASSQGNLAGFTRIMMFKRLSSSGPAFIATLRRHRLRHLVAIHALKNGLELPIGSVSNTVWADEDDTELDAGLGNAAMSSAAHDDQISETAYNTLRETMPIQIRWAPPRMFGPRLLTDLRHDVALIDGMLSRFGTWDAQRDNKLSYLEELISVKHPDDKVLVFTEAADTAHYVFRELHNRGIGQVAVVTGGSKNPTELAQRFSPRSNNVVVNGGPLKDELRVLISTDVLSEGQNLQDAHIVVNYDLPWAIVNLVQRAGRVDRIGQNSPDVLLCSLMPAEAVEQEIKLRHRIRERLGENAQLLGSDEQFFDEINEDDILSGVYDESSSYGLSDVGIEEVDPVSMAYEVWRLAKKKHPELAKQAAELPNIVYSTKAAATGGVETGVLLHTQTTLGADVFGFVERNGDSRRVTPQEALRLAECEPETDTLPRIPNHHELTAIALNGALRSPMRSASGPISGVRRKVWRALYDHMDSFKDNLLFQKRDLQQAHDAINEYPLYESATHKLSVAQRERTVDDLAALVVELHNNNLLCVPPRSDNDENEPSIVCTMGLRK